MDCRLNFGSLHTIKNKTLKKFLHFLCLIICILIILITTDPWSNTWFQPELSISTNNGKFLPNKPRRVAIFSSSIHSLLRSYIFYTPITAAAWQRIGYEVIVVFVGDFTSNLTSFYSAQLNLSRAFLERLGVRIINFQCEKSYSIKMSQLVRIFVGYLSDSIVNDTDYILTTDSDMIPIREEDYRLKENTIGFIYNAFCCASFQRREKSYPMYPMSHLCFAKKIWRQFFLESIQRNELLSKNLSSDNSILLSDQAPFSFETISLYTRHEFKDLYDSNMTKGDIAWYMDQIYSSMLIHDYHSKHRNLSIDKRYKTSLRLDPYLQMHMWDKQKLKDYGDAHIIHDQIFDSYHWIRFCNFLRFLFNTSLVNDFDYYYKQFTLILRANSSHH